MRAITYQVQTDTFSAQTLPMPEITSPNDVLIKVLAVGVNPVDAKINLWHSMVRNMSDSFVGGLDVSGEIVEVGGAVKEWKVGDRVLYHGDMRRHHGGFAEYAIHDARTLIAHPDVAPEIAAATPCAGWTAMQAVESRLHVAGRKNIFIAGGSGGVGSFAIQLARHAGCGQIITTCSAANHDFVRSLGATDVIDYQTQDIEARVMAITDDDGVDVALDCVGGDSDIDCANVLRYEGHLVELVRTVRPEAYRDAFMRGLIFHQLSLGAGHVNGEYGRKSIRLAGERFGRLLERGAVMVPRLSVIEFDELPQAIVAMRAQRTVGKVVAKIASA
uniref:zinc-binding dehydrogenase n=1 Tax=Thaumasiovibrio occultus TaxID=1891184 RepID=UPI000B34ECBB|nr:zinc-binding dehydrogenase [Thaumasiovibrio occultus]